MQMQYHITIMCNREEQANLGINSKNLILRAKGQISVRQMRIRLRIL